MLAMGRNAHDSPWRSTPADMRKRKPVTLTLSEKIRAKLDRLADARGRGMRSAIVEELIEKAKEP